VVRPAGSRGGGHGRLNGQKREPSLSGQPTPVYREREKPEAKEEADPCSGQKLQPNFTGVAMLPCPDQPAYLAAPVRTERSQASRRYCRREETSETKVASPLVFPLLSKYA
jgi:hypothetical protein